MLIGKILDLLIELFLNKKNRTKRILLILLFSMVILIRLIFKIIIMNETESISYLNNNFNISSKKDFSRESINLDMEVSHNGMNDKNNDFYLSKMEINYSEVENHLLNIYGDVSYEFHDYSIEKRNELIGKKKGFVSDEVMKYGNNPSSSYAEVIEDILRNPIMGDMVATAFLTFDEIKLENPWLEEFIYKTDDAISVDTDDNQIGRWSVWLEKIGDNKFYVTREYRLYACRLCEILGTFRNRGLYETGKISCKAYWEFSDGMKRTRVIYEEIAPPALVMSRENGDGTTTVIGFDTRDKGMLIYDDLVLNE